MGLSLEIVISCPSENDIVQALSMIEGRDSSWIVLSRSEGTFMQTDGISLEHQEGSVDYHYYACDSHILTASISETLLSYARGDDWWKRSFIWNQGFTPY
jgi:hypothetical protein